MIWWQSGTSICNGPAEEMANFENAIQIPDRPDPSYIYQNGNWIPDPNYYVNLRKMAYPSVGDQLDAIWKELSAMQASGTILSSDTQIMLTNINNIKTEFPKSL